MGLKTWFKDSFWTKERPVAYKSLLYVFLMVGGWNIGNSYDWGFGYVLKQTFIIWCVGGLALILAVGHDKKII